MDYKTQWLCSNVSGKGVTAVFTVRGSDACSLLFQAYWINLLAKLIKAYNQLPPQTKLADPVIPKKIITRHLSPWL